MTHTPTQAVLLCLALTCLSQADDWPQFRGPGGRGISTETDVPLSWDQERNVRWRAELPQPGNNGSPIVSRDTVFLAVATDDGHTRSLHAYDRNSGQLRWVRSVTFDGEETTHGTNLHAGSTPAADGERVVVWHSSAGMHCYDYDGELLWSADLGQFKHIWGYGASPIIYGDLVIQSCGPGTRQFVAALDKRSGKTVWKVDEPDGRSEKDKPWVGSWSTPVIAQIDGQDRILVSWPYRVKAYDPTDGAVPWQCDGLGDLVYTSPVVGDGLAVVLGGFHGPAIGFSLSGSGNVTEENLLWRVEKNPQRIGSGVILDGRMFMIDDKGNLDCLDPRTGESQWQAKLPGGPTWSSLVYAARRLYLTTQDAETIVFAADPEKLEVLSVNPLDERTNSTPAVSDGQIFLRTYKAIYCIDD